MRPRTRRAISPGLLVFLGLLGTFYGLLETVTHVASTIQALDTSTGDTASAVRQSASRVSQARSSGMGTAFSASLLGLTGSLILGFLDLQTSQAQNAFYTDLEDWMTSMTELDHPMTQMQATGLGVQGEEMSAMIERLGSTMQNSDSLAERHPRHGRTGHAASTGWSSTSAPNRPICASTSKSRATPTRSCAS